MVGEAEIFYTCIEWTIWLETQLRLSMYVKNTGQVKWKNSLLIVYEELTSWRKVDTGFIYIAEGRANNVLYIFILISLRELQKNFQ